LTDCYPETERGLPISAALNTVSSVIEMQTEAVENMFFAKFFIKLLSGKVLCQKF